MYCCALLWTLLNVVVSERMNVLAYRISNIESKLGKDSNISKFDIILYYIYIYTCITKLISILCNLIWFQAIIDYL